MKYVNANTTFYESLESISNNPVSFKYPFDTIQGEYDKNTNLFVVPDFVIVTNISILGTNNENEQKDHVLYNHKALHVILRLTKCDKNPENQLGTDIDKFDLDFKTIDPDMACYPFYNYSRISYVTNLKAPYSGTYVLKTLVRDDSSKEFSIQSMRKLVITEKITS